MNSMPWDNLRLNEVEDGGRRCNDACGAAVVSLVAEVRRLDVAAAQHGRRGGASVNHYNVLTHPTTGDVVGIVVPPKEFSTLRATAAQVAALTAALTWAVEWMEAWEGEVTPEWREWQERARAILAAAPAQTAPAEPREEAPRGNEGRDTREETSDVAAV